MFYNRFKPVIAGVILGISILTGCGSAELEQEIVHLIDETTAESTQETTQASKYNPEPLETTEYVKTEYVPSEEFLNQDEWITVCLDPGHGGRDVGASYGSHTEKEQGLEMCLLIREYLKQYDVHVVLTREEDISMPSLDGPLFANEQYADVLVSIHRNKYKTSDVRGVEIWIGKARKDEDVRLAKILMEKMGQVDGTKLRGIEGGSTADRDKDYFVNRYSHMPSCIIELGFMSNKKDNELWENHKEDYARLIGDGILEFLGVEH